MTGAEEGAHLKPLPEDTESEEHLFDEKWQMKCGVCAMPIVQSPRPGASVQTVLTRAGPMHKSCWEKTDEGRKQKVEVKGACAMGCEEGNHYSAKKEESEGQEVSTSRKDLIQIDAKFMDPVAMVECALGKKKKRKKEKKGMEVVPTIGRWTMLFRFQLSNAVCAGLDDCYEKREADSFLRCLVCHQKAHLRLRNGYPPATAAPIKLVGGGRTFSEMVDERTEDLLDPGSRRSDWRETLLFLVAWGAAWLAWIFLFKGKTCKMLDGFANGWPTFQVAQQHGLDMRGVVVQLAPVHGHSSSDEEVEQGVGAMEVDTGGGDGGEPIEAPKKRKLPKRDCGRAGKA